LKDDVEQLSESGLNLEQTIAVAQFKNYLKKRSVHKGVKEVFKNDDQCWAMAVDYLTTQFIPDPLAFDLWYAHWSGKWNKRIVNKNRFYAHLGLKKFVIQRFYDEKNKRN